MKEDQSNKKKGWFDFLRPLRSALSRSEFNALFDQRNYYSRELEDIANHGAKTLVDEWALETSKKASKQLQGDVTLPDFRFLPDVYWDNGAFSYNVDGKEVKDDKKTQVSRLKELSDHYDLPLPDKAEEVVSRDSFEKILGHYYKDDKGNVFKPEPSGDLRLDLESVPLIPVNSFISNSNVAYGNITMEDFSKLKLVSMSDKEVNDFKERSRKAVDGSNILKQTIEDIRTYLNGEQYLGSVGFEGRVPASTGLSFRTSDSPLSFPVDSYHAKDGVDPYQAKGDYTISLLSHKAMQNGEPVHLDIDKYNAWQYSSILSKLDDYILESSNKDIKEMNDVVRRLEKLSKDTDQQFITRNDKDSVVVDYDALSDKGQELLFRDAGAYERSLDKFCIHGNRSVELEGSLTENGQSLVDAWGDKDYLQDPDTHTITADSQTRQVLLNALKVKEKELLVWALPEKERQQKGAEIFEALKYKCSKVHLFKGNIPIEDGINFHAGNPSKNYIADTYTVTDNNIYLYANKDVFTEGWAVLRINKNNAWKCLPQLEAFRKSVVERECEDIKEMNKVADHLAELTKDKEKKFPTRDTNGNLAFDASNITKNGDISFYVHDEYGESRLAKAFIITGNRSVECAIYDNRLISLGEEGRRKVLDAMKFKERELEIDLKHEKEQVLTAAEEYAQLKKYDHQYFKLPSGEVYYAEASADNKIGHGILSLYELKLPMGDRDEKPSVYGVDTFGKTVFLQMTEQEVNEFHQLIEKNKEDLANEEKNAESKVTSHSTTESPESTSQTQDKDGQSVQSGYTTDLPLPDREVADDAVLERRGWQDPQDVEEVSGRWHTQAMKEADAYRAYSRLLIAKMSSQENNDSMPWVSKTTGIPKSIEGKPYEGISGLMLAMNTEKEGYDLPIYLDKEEASSMQLKLDPFAVTFPVIGKDGKVTELYNVDQIDFREQHPRQYEQFSHDNSAEIRIKENEAISLNTLATNGLWYVPVKEDGKENLAVYSLADKAIHIAPMEDYRENRDNYYRDLTIAMVSSTRLNNTNSGFKRYLKEDLISHLGSAMLSQKYRFSFNANNPDVSHFWKEMIRNNTNSTKSFLQAAEASANRVYSRVEEVARNDNREESDSLDLQTTTPGTGDEDGDGIADDQENYAPEKKKVSNPSEESSKIREVHHFKR